MKTQKPVLPEKQWGYLPIWCHHHSSKFSVARQTNEFLQLEASAAKIVISQDPDSKGWALEYEVIHAFGGFGVKGKIHMTTDQLEVAFGLRDALKDQFDCTTGQWLLDRYGADAASQGCFIRYQDFLNIPAPGTGHDGDANVSIELDDGIKAAVKNLIEKLK